MKESYEFWFGGGIPGSTHEAGLLMPATEIGEVAPHFLYRLFNADNTLLYIGITRDLRDRFAQHAGEKDWWPEATRKTVALYLSEKKARAAETLAINDEDPRHNQQRPHVAPPVDFRTEFKLMAGEWSNPIKFLFEMVTFVLSATDEDVAAWHAHMAITGTKTLGAALSHGRDPRLCTWAAIKERVQVTSGT